MKIKRYTTNQVKFWWNVYSAPSIHPSTHWEATTCSRDPQAESKPSSVSWAFLFPTGHSQKTSNQSPQEVSYSDVLTTSIVWFWWGGVAVLLWPSQMIKLLSISVRTSTATLQRKLISATCICLAFFLFLSRAHGYRWGQKLRLISNH